MGQIRQFPNSFFDEFKTVEILLDSSCVTGRADAFVIAWVKSERQVRRIFSYLIYQFPVFERKDVEPIIQTITSRNNLNFDDFINGFNKLYPKTYKDIVGASYDILKTDHAKIKKFRNKLFHGQPTGQNLSEKQLRNEIMKIQNWCFEVAEKMNGQIGYDGFTRNSFRKSTKEDFSSIYKVQIKSLDEFKGFLAKIKGG